MPHSPLPVLIHNIPVFLPRMCSKCLPPADHDQEHSSARQPDKSCGDKAVLVAQMVDPRRDTITVSICCSTSAPGGKVIHTHTQ